MPKKYDVALSFAGEDREYAEELTKLLTTDGYLVFYDRYEEATLWGKDLYSHFSSVYKDQAKYCVMFLSQHYAKKLWTRHERESAQARAFKENQEYILPIRIDDTEIPGILQTVGILDLREKGIQGVYKALVEKLGAQTGTIDKQTGVAAIEEFGKYTLLLSNDGQEHFLPVQQAEWDKSEIKLHLCPESPTEIAFLRSLRDKDEFSRRESLAIALEGDATWVTLHRVMQSMSGNQSIWIVDFTIENNQSNIDFSEIQVNNISPDEIANMRAQRILLNTKPSLANDEVLDLFVWGGAFTHNARDLPNSIDCPFPRLYESYGETPERFLKFARLAASLYLKLTNTVEAILDFKLEVLNPKMLQVNFKGRRRQHYVNVEPAVIEVNGICTLSSN